jgi:hypothetical protein
MYSINVGEKFTDEAIEIFKKSKTKDIILFKILKIKTKHKQTN